MNTATSTSVMVIDDDPQVCQLLGNILENEGAPGRFAAKRSARLVDAPISAGRRAVHRSASRRRRWTSIDHFRSPQALARPRRRSSSPTTGPWSLRSVPSGWGRGRLSDQAVSRRAGDAGTGRAACPLVARSACRRLQRFAGRSAASSTPADHAGHRCRKARPCGRRPGARPNAGGASRNSGSRHRRARRGQGTDRPRAIFGRLSTLDRARPLSKSTAAPSRKSSSKPSSSARRS